MGDFLTFETCRLGKMVQSVPVSETDTLKNIIHRFKFQNTPYPILSFIAKGGNSMVYDCDTVVRKVCNSYWTDCSSLRELIILGLCKKIGCKFLPEMKKWEIDETTGEISFVMEKYQEVGKKDLKKGKMGILEALTVLHGYGILHADLKKDNVMKKDDHCIVIDFSNSEWVYPPFTRIDYLSLSTNCPQVVPSNLEQYPQQYWQYDMWAFSNLCQEKTVEDPIKRPTKNDYTKTVSLKKIVSPDYPGHLKSKFIRSEGLKNKEYMVMKPDFDQFVKSQNTIDILYPSTVNYCKEREKLLDRSLGEVRKMGYQIQVWFYAIQLFDWFSEKIEGDGSGTSGKEVVNCDSKLLMVCFDLSLRILQNEQLEQKIDKEMEMELLRSGLIPPKFVVGVCVVKFMEENVKNEKPLFYDINRLDWMILKEMNKVINVNGDKYLMKKGGENWNEFIKDHLYNPLYEDKFEKDF